MKTKRLISIFFFILLSGFIAAPAAVSTEEENGETNEKFNASSFILEHIADSHEWHLFGEGENSVIIYLPVIIYDKESGFHVFSSRKIAHGHIHNGFTLAEEGDLEGRIVKVDAGGNINEEYLPVDLSMTKTVVAMLSAAIIGLILFISLARSYKKTGISHPKGMQSFLEPIILFIRDDVAIPNIGHKADRYMPYLLTVFTFIIINNVMGLIPFPPPFGGNVTGNIAVTLVLATCTFLVTQFSGNRNHWRHVFATPGVPVWLLPIMIPVEIIGLFSRPFALMIRLFANITAGHILVLSLISLIFIFNSIFMSPVSIVFVVFMDFMELLVAFLQAYIFTLLSALFIGLAVAEEHH